jgi:hypothetical protein
MRGKHTIQPLHRNPDYDALVVIIKVVEDDSVGNANDYTISCLLIYPRNKTLILC